jgi:hypothetical protein
MTTMTRFVPFRSPLDGVAVLQNRLNSIFNDFTSPSGELQNEMKALVPVISSLRSIFMRTRTASC